MSVPTTAAVMKIVKRTDKNTRALAKVVSAEEYLCDAYVGFAEVTEARQLLQAAKFDLIQERRNLRMALWSEMKKQIPEVSK